MELEVFNFKENEVRTVVDDGEILFVAKDICDILDYQNTSTTLSKLDDDEKGIKKIYTLGGEQDMMCINESGLYTLILRSNKSEAKVFRKWVTSEVLPSIRKTGTYDMELQPNLDYQGGKVAHIFHNHQLNPTAFLNVKLINKLENMFGKKNTREFYSEMIGIKIDKTLSTIEDEQNPVELFVKEMINVNTDNITKVSVLFDHYTEWLRKYDIKGMLSQGQFSRKFAEVTKLKNYQKRFNMERHRVFKVEVTI